MTVAEVKWMAYEKPERAQRSCSQTWPCEWESGKTTLAPVRRKMPHLSCGFSFGEQEGQHSFVLGEHYLWECCPCYAVREPRRCVTTPQHHCRICHRVDHSRMESSLP